MYENRSAIIHRYGLGGIGDFLRGVYTLYTICKREGVDYYIDFGNNVNMNKCFITKPIPEWVKNSGKEYHHYDFRDKTKILDLIICCRINNRVVILESDCFGLCFGEDIRPNVPIIHSNYLIPSLEVEIYNKYIYEKYNLVENNYVSVHFRMGDNIMRQNMKNQSSIELDIIQIYHNKLQSFIKKYNISIPVVIHSDSVFLKQKMFEKNNQYIIIDIEIQHISDKIGKNVESSYISTISEFIIISMSNSVVIFEGHTNVPEKCKYSGFSHLASVSKNKPLYVSGSDIYNRFEYLGPSNIILFDMDEL
jgi:hypothetical protein